MFYCEFNCMMMLRRQPYIFTQKSAVVGLCVLALALSRSDRVLASPIRDNNPLLEYSDQVRLRHLYTDNKDTHLHLQITPEGEVSGTQEQNVYSLLEIKAVKPSILVIRGIKSTLYLCMDSRHHLYGSTIYKEDDCNFRELPLANGYNLYFSEKYPAQLTLTSTKQGHSSGRQMTRFIPRESTIPLEALYAVDHTYEYKPGSYINNDDPLGMKDLSAIFSPSLD